MVVLIRQPPRLDLERHMPVTQVIGRARQQMNVVRFHGGKQLRSCPHLHHQRAVFGGEPLTVLERQTACEEQPNFSTAVQFGPQARATPQLEHQRQGIGRAPAIGRVEHVFEHLHGRLHQNKK